MSKKHDTRRALVIGAHGQLGTLVVAAMERAGWDVVAGVRRPDVDGRERRVDLGRPETVAAALDGVDVAVSVVPDHTLTAERMVLERGGAMVNLSALPAAAGRTLRTLAEDARGTVLMNAGVAPGLTNVVAADLLARHPEADEVEMVFTIATRSTAGPAAADFAHRNLTTVRHHRTTMVPLPAPFGVRRCLGFAEPDGGWLTPLDGGQVVRTYVCFAERPAHAMMLALNRSRLISRLPHALLAAGSTRGQVEASREPVAHWVAVRRDGHRVAARTLEGSGDYRMAAETAPLFARQLLGNDAEGAVPSGVWNPEELVTLERILGPLRDVDITVVDRTEATASRGGV